MTDDEWQAIQQIADHLTPAMRAAFLNAVRTLTAHVDVPAVADALARGQVAQAERLIGASRLSAELGPSVAIMRRAVTQAVSVAASQLAASRGVATLSFDIVNPFAVRYIEQAAARFVTEVTAETQLAIRAFVRTAVADGVTSAETAQLIRPVIGLTSRDAGAVMNYRATLVKNGITPIRASRMGATYASRKVRERAETIARTELIDASAAGQQALWREAIARGYLPADFTQAWFVTPDDRLCPVCAAMAGQTRKIGERFVSPYNGETALRPPMHPRCRCALRRSMATASQQAAA